MAKRKKPRARTEEEILVEAPDEEPVEDVELEEPSVSVSFDVVEAEVPPVQAQVESEPVCSKCGLPKKDFYPAWAKLRTDLKASNGKKKCPRCWEPTEPY